MPFGLTLISLFSHNELVLEYPNLELTTDCLESNIGTKLNIEKEFWVCIL